MSKESQIIRSKELLHKYVFERFGIETTIEPLKYKRSKSRSFYCLDEFACSAGPFIWIQNRLREKDEMPPAGCPLEPDDFTALRITSSFCEVAPVARSKVFKTSQFPMPIDLTAGRVAPRLRFPTFYAEWQ